MGREIGRQTLKTSGEESVLQICPEEREAKMGQIVFIPLRYTDKEGIWKPMVKERLRVSVKNGALMGLGSANAYVKRNYAADTVSIHVKKYTDGVCGRLLIKRHAIIFY